MFKKFNFKTISNEDISFIIEELKKGRVLAYPSDTIYGIGCDAESKMAVEKIFKIKKRDDKHPLLILVNNFSMLKKYCYISCDQERELRKIWNKNEPPTTVILKSKKNLPSMITCGHDSIAVRMLRNNGNLQKIELLIKIIEGIALPLISTSLNKSGEETLKSLESIDNYFTDEKLDLAIDAGTIERTSASRLIDFRDISNLKILRE